MVKKFLHIGPGTSYKNNTTPIFNSNNWDEVRLDIDPEVKPDILSSMLDMKEVKSNSFDAVFSSHNIEHVFAYQVNTAFSEMYRVLNNKGYLVITCPDIQQVSIEVAKGNLTNPLYHTANNKPIAAIDIMYGYGSSLKEGNHFMAHKCGFADKVLFNELKRVGFKSISVIKATTAYALWAIAYKNTVIPQDRLESDLLSHLPYKKIINNG